MDIASVFAEYLEDMGHGTVGSSIFTGQINESDDGLFVVHAGGSLNNYLPIETSVVDVYSIDTSSLTAKTRLESVKRTIHRMHTTELDDAFIFSILSLGDVETIERDLEYRKIYKLTFSVMLRDTNLIS